MSALFTPRIAIYRFCYRIAAHKIRLKPLRERPEEIESLARLFLSEFSQRSGRTVRANDETLKLLENFNWHGNVRELRSFVQKACIGILLFAENENLRDDEIQLTREFLSSRLVAFALERNAESDSLSALISHFRLGEKMEEYIEEIELHLLQKAMNANNNNQTQAARDLGLSRGGLIKKLKRRNH